MISTNDDIADALVRGMEEGGLVLAESELSPQFFDLRSGLAGELMQKFVNYGARLAIVVPDPSVHGERFCELVHEHRRHPNVRFFGSAPEAYTWLGIEAPGSAA